MIHTTTWMDLENTKCKKTVPKNTIMTPLPKKSRVCQSTESRLVIGQSGAGRWVMA
jgi:hypothetical protein